MRIHVGLTLILLTPWAARAAPPVSVPAVHTFDPERPDKSCAENVPCAVWRSFRVNHPWPLQSYVIHETPGYAVVILSEPPPTLSKAQLVEGLTALFADDLVSLEYYRLLTGIDGWLEDVVAYIRVPESARTRVLSGDTLSLVDAPADVVDRLRHLYRLQYLTSGGFWLASTKRPPVTAIPDLRVRAHEYDSWLAQPGDWKTLKPASNSRTTQQLHLEKAPGVFRRDGGLVALVVPPRSRLADLEVPFRHFAVESDLVLAATGTPTGSFLLARQGATAAAHSAAALAF